MQGTGPEAGFPLSGIFNAVRNFSLSFSINSTPKLMKQWENKHYTRLNMKWSLYLIMEIFNCQDRIF